MTLCVRAAGVVWAAVGALVWGSASALAAESLLWANEPGLSSLTGNFSFVRVNEVGAETDASRCADDFVLPDFGGAGAPVVVTQINTDIVSDGAPGADHEAIAEVWSDSGGVPGVRLHQFGAGRRVELIQTDGSLQRWLYRFEAMAAALTPGVRYWLVIAVRTPDSSNQGYFRLRAEGVTGLQAHRIQFNGPTPDKGFDVTQELYGYQVTACPPLPVEGTLMSGSSNHAATAAIVQVDRLVRDGDVSACGGALECEATDDDNLRGGTVHSFWNSSDASACVEVTLDQPCGLNGAYAVAYGMAYDTGDLCSNYAGDAGTSSAVQSFSFDVMPGQVFHVVVHEVESAPGCAYTLWVRGLPLCCDKCTGDANGDGEVDFDDIVEVLGMWLMGYGALTGPGDANCDAFVDFEDVVAVLGNWLRECADSRE